MKNAIIVHGMPGKEEYYSSKYPSSSNFQWLPWLQKQLLMKDIFAVTPEMFLAFNPDYSIWKREFERHEVTPETILVGHSCGGGFLVRWLSENKTAKTGKVFLVAPWLDPESSLVTGFFDFEIDAALTERVESLTIFHSTDDDEDIAESVGEIIRKIPQTKLIQFTNKGHFIGEEFAENGFPELLEEILK